MINVSNEFKELMMKRQDFKEHAEVTFLDGTVVTLDEDDFSVSNNSIVDAADNNAIPIGTAVCRSIQLELLNDDGHLEEYEFYGAKVRLFLTFALSDSVEKIECGTFTVTSPETYGTVVSVNAFDDMYKSNVDYTSDLTFPATASSVLLDICDSCGITLADTTFLHNDFVIQEKPSEEYTCRQIIGYIAMIACGNARINRLGKLEIITYDLDFDSGDYHDLTEWVNLTLGTSDIVVTGIQTIKEVTTENDEGKEETEKVVVSAGEEGYVLTVENPLVEGNEETLVSWIHERISGIPFRKITGDYITYPLAEFMDRAKVTDWKGNIYYTFLTDINFTFFGLTSFKNSAEEGLRNSSKYINGNAKTNIYLQELIKKERSAREKALENLNIILDGASGVYATSEKQEDGSYIHYLHNKSTLEESSMIWKMTAEAWAVSSDGGKTWNAGMTVDGDAIAKILTAMGVNADWINTGAITVKDDDGNIIFQVNMDTNKVILSGDSIQIGDKSINDAIEETKNLSMQLSNEFQSIATDANGNISGTFPVVATRVIVMYGSQDITAECSYTISKSDAISGKWDDSTKSYTVTGITADEGWVDIRATYLKNLSVVKRFTVAKLKAGKNGIDGADGKDGADGAPGAKGDKGDTGAAGRTYFIESSSNVLKRSADNTFSPNFIEFKAYYRDGTSATRTAYNGRFVIEETKDGNTWTTIYTSSANENTVKHHLYSVPVDGVSQAISDSTNTIGIPRDVTNIRCKLYAAGGTTTLMDMESVAVVVDVDALTHEEIFDLLTNNGTVKGIYKEGNQLYISFTYAKGGTLTLGGKENGNGLLSLRDTNGNEIASQTVEGTKYYNKNHDVKYIQNEKGCIYYREYSEDRIEGLVIGDGEELTGIADFLGIAYFSGTADGSVIIVSDDYIGWDKNGALIINSSNGISTTSAKAKNINAEDNIEIEELTTKQSIDDRYDSLLEMLKSQKSKIDTLEQRLQKIEDLLRKE